MKRQHLHIIFFCVCNYLLNIPLSLASEPVVDTPPSQTESEDALDRRLEDEKIASEQRFSIIPHKPNYLLPFSYNDTPNQAPFLASGQELQHEEFKFQFSFKIPVGRSIFADNSQLYFAYTQLAFWQAYNTSQSSPFRESNYEPELFVSFTTDYQLLGLRTRLINIGFNHQSNGQSDPFSRSWNRVFLDIQMVRNNFLLSFKPWHRIAEQPADDNNPDIEDYLGHFELTTAYRHGDHVVSLMLRNNLHADNRGAVQLDWTIPVDGKLNAYLQLFHGYGESLIDYNARSNRIGLGFSLASWL